jgi:hypothetical protein
MPLGDEMLAGTGMADDWGLAFPGEYVFLGSMFAWGNSDRDEL